MLKWLPRLFKPMENFVHWVVRSLSISKIDSQFQDWLSINYRFSILLLPLNFKTDFSISRMRLPIAGFSLFLKTAFFCFFSWQKEKISFSPTKRSSQLLTAKLVQPVALETHAKTLQLPPKKNVYESITAGLSGANHYNNFSKFGVQRKLAVLSLCLSRSRLSEASFAWLLQKACLSSWALSWLES